MKLVRPNKVYEKSWRKAVAEFRHDRKSIKLWEVLGNPDNLEACVKVATDHSNGKDLPYGWVPYDMLWLLDNGEIIGIVSIRRRLNENLLQRGGNIGYEIVPSERGKGYGKKILELSLLWAKDLGMKKVLVTSFKDNIASRKVIKANGGKFENKIMVAGENDATFRYWISLQ